MRNNNDDDALFPKAYHQTLGDTVTEDTIALVDRHVVYASVPYGKMAWHPFRILSFILIFLWGSFMILLWLTKEISEGSNDTFWMYLTNWSWALQCVYWATKFLGYSESLVTYRLVETVNYTIYHVYYWLFWPTFMINTGVTWVVLLVLYDSPGLLTNYFDDFGPGFVFVMNFIFHVATYILMVADVILTFEDLVYMLNRSAVSLVRYFFAMFAIANVILLSYMSTHNIHDVYGLDDFGYWFIILTFEFVIFVPNSILMGVMSPLKFLYRTGFSLTPRMQTMSKRYETVFV